jgi:hypothetical protein
MDDGPVADYDHDEQQDCHHEQAGGFGGVDGMAVPVFIVRWLLWSGSGHGDIVAASLWASTPPLETAEEGVPALYAV